ncbi:uncharacterized protein LOC114075357 [Solanum pennellii]|uniref:Uncharacterized protein LOC114075357 n=1 Tax=Solanum pennellii TaxID=28526 RepID=A0ABM1V1K5_SOLPN|nr:uncharacterized protein LOC114075357 [Solanum pennellii]
MQFLAGKLPFVNALVGWKFILKEMANCLEDEDERISNLAKLSFMGCQRKGKRRPGGMVLKSKLSLKRTGQRTKKNVLIRFTRRTYIMPSIPPAVDIFLMKWLITETSKQSLLQFSFSMNL